MDIYYVYITITFTTVISIWLYLGFVNESYKRERKLAMLTIILLILALIITIYKLTTL